MTSQHGGSNSLFIGPFLWGGSAGIAHAWRLTVAPEGGGWCEERDSILELHRESPPVQLSIFGPSGTILLSSFHVIFEPLGTIQIYRETS